MNVSLRQMRAFVAVARCASFTGAAKELNLTQSALSLLIKDLESELGVRLIERTTRAVALSDVGSELLPSINQVLQDLDQSHHRQLRAVVPGSHALGAHFLATDTGKLDVRVPALEFDNQSRAEQVTRCFTCYQSDAQRTWTPPREQASKCLHVFRSEEVAHAQVATNSAQQPALAGFNEIQQQAYIVG